MRAVRTLLALFISLAAYGQVESAQVYRRANKEKPLLVTAVVASAYNALAPLGRAERTAVLRALSPQMRSSVWRAHMVFFINDHPELTAEQQAAIAAISDALVPVLFDSTHAADLDTLAARIDLDKATDSAKRVLPAQVIAAIVYSVGPPKEDTPATHLKAHVELVGDCTCAGFDGGDPCYEQCYHDRICQFLQDGCGAFGLDPCSATCHEV